VLVPLPASSAGPPRQRAQGERSKSAHTGSLVIQDTLRKRSVLKLRPRLYVWVLSDLIPKRNAVKKLNVSNESRSTI